MPSLPFSTPRTTIIGGGPAGLFAAERLHAAGIEVDLYESKGSVGRKFLIAGKGGLNLTHSDRFDTFVARYRERSDEVAQWLRRFDADALRNWARAQGVDTYVGSSGRVFPLDRKAAPLLRGWVRRLRESGVRFHVQHHWRGWSAQTGALQFDTPHGPREAQADTVLLALGGGSWPELGSDGAWQTVMQAAGIDVAPLQPANCGFDIAWSEYFRSRHAGAPLKPVVASWTDDTGRNRHLQGECVITATGIEGSLIYALSAMLREHITMRGPAILHLDLAPDRRLDDLMQALAKPAGKRTLAERLRRDAGIHGVKTALLHEVLSRDQMRDPERLAVTIKSLPLRLLRPRPIEEAISSAGGVRLEACDDHLMLRAYPGVFVAGEMLDWEAPTGGYLLTACFASAYVAAEGISRWLGQAETQTEFDPAAASAMHRQRQTRSCKRFQKDASSLSWADCDDQR